MTHRLAQSAITLVAIRRDLRGSVARCAGVLLALSLGCSALAESMPQGQRGTSLRAAETAGSGQPAHPADLLDLPAQARDAFSAGRPLVLMFSLRGCPWCDALRREHFAALLREQNRLGVLAVEIDLADSRAFSAPSSTPAEHLPASMRAGSPRELGRFHKVRLAPTVLFIGPQGELAERLVGYGSPDFFGAYLEQRISQSRAALAAATR
jgi:thioredoxin-related protein